MYCKDIPYNEAKHEGRKKMAYGPWLRAEVKTNSPYWNIFYNPKDKLEQVEEVVPETPPPYLPTVPLLPPPSTLPLVNNSSVVQCFKAPIEAPN